MKANVTINEVNHEDLVDLFSTAIYDSHWFSVDYDDSADKNEDDCYEDVIAKILLNGGSVRITDFETDGDVYGNLPHELDEQTGNVTYWVTLADVIRGLERSANGSFNAGEDDSDWRDRQISFAKRSFNAFANDDRDWDAITADCLMHIIVFDEVIYG